ncbi:MAG: hypothetical protein KGJ86_17265, partial [Chloroflexota bacterium]|nr:hypothetical protein [Chloroflexota bacterium]
VAVLGSLFGGSTGGPAMWLAAASTGSSGLLTNFAKSLGPAYAFGAGLLAAVNPCGFAMLPGFMALYLRDGRPGVPKVARVTLVSGTVTAGFIVLFGVVGLLLGVADAALGRALPWASLIAGLVLVIAGARMLAGRPVQLSQPAAWGGVLSPAAARPGLIGYGTYGLAYGLTSLSCTLPLFLTVVGLSFGRSVGASVLQFVLYALGMGLVVFLAAVAVAAVRGTVLLRVRSAAAWLNGLAGGLLLLVGGYIVYYWLTFGNLSV